MKVLSLMQPWASLVVMGIKTIETRSWATDYRGPLFIHASKSRAGKAMLPLLPESALLPAFDALPFGAIIGEVILADIVPCSSLPRHSADWEEGVAEGRAFGAYTGKHCWLFSNAQLLDEPIPATGRLGLWEI